LALRPLPSHWGDGCAAFEPFRVFPLLLLAYAGLVLMLDGAAPDAKRVRKAALAGWGFGFGFFLVGVHWVGYAFLVDPGAHAWQLPFVMVLFPGALALFFAPPRLFQRVASDSRRVSCSRLFFIAEWLRGHSYGLSGSPGYGWAASLVLQSASVIGVYGCRC
jgi:apolipoprotein N-acyltransferase